MILYVRSIGRQDDKSGKIELQAKSQTIYDNKAYIYVPIETLKNYRIDDPFYFHPVTDLPSPEDLDAVAAEDNAKEATK